MSKMQKYTLMGLMLLILCLVTWALATGLGWVLVNLMWTVIKRRLDRRAAERQTAEPS